jgi:PKD repeat protein
MMSHWVRLLHVVLIGTLVGNFLLPLSAQAYSGQSAVAESSRTIVSRHQQTKLPFPTFLHPHSNLISTTNTITITNSGLEPSVLTTTIGAEVMWSNETLLTHIVKSGNASFVFLPVILKEDGASGSTLGSEAERPPSAELRLAESETFSGTVLPGGILTHTFSTTGTHPYFLATAPTVSGAIVVEPAAPATPTLTLTADPISGTVPLTVTFIATPTDFALGALDYEWEFGDGITATLISAVIPISISHTYTKAGIFTASLTIKDSQNQTATQELSMTTSQANLNLSLSSSPTSGTVPLLVQFTAASQNPASNTLTYTWDFGDGLTRAVTLTGTAPITADRLYPNIGTYTVTTILSDGLNTAVSNKVITVNDIDVQLPPDPVTVAPALDQSTATNIFGATEFLYTGPNPIQTGVVSGTIETRRVSVLRGKVFDRNGDPLSGVTITILNHPEFGQTLSREDGAFDLVVNGGGLLAVKYERPGYLPAQRQVNAPWQDYVALPDVVLIPYGAKSTPVDLNSGQMQVAQGSVISDTDGERQVTVLFPPGTEAYINLTDGTTRTLTTLNFRPAEYTVGPNGRQAMPGDLPPQTAYTYAVELGTDEVVGDGVKINGKDVIFNQSIPLYVDNFLEFPIGVHVPAGYYDNDQGIWIPTDSGQIIKIVSITNGLADIDTDGDSNADDTAALAVLGITEAEREQLAILYGPNKSLWRVMLAHFSIYDLNWPRNLPWDAIAYLLFGPDNNEPVAKSCPVSGSIIEAQNQILGEVVDITGTPFTLNYRSHRLPGYTIGRTLNIPLSGDTLPDSLKRIELEVEVAGQRFVSSFPRETNLSYDYVWDGLDVYERPVQGKQSATVRIGYTYDAVYQQTDRFGDSGIASSVISLSSARPEITVWRTFHTSLSNWDTRALGLGGWSLDIQHIYDPVGKVIQLGTGERRSAENMNLIINTVTGGGSSLQEGIPALETRFVDLTSVELAPDGTQIVGAKYRVRQVNADGIVTTVAGTGTPGSNVGDGGRQSRLIWGAIWK